MYTYYATNINLLHNASSFVSDSASQNRLKGFISFVIDLQLPLVPIAIFTFFDLSVLCVLSFISAPKTCLLGRNFQLIFTLSAQNLPNLEVLKGTGNANSRCAKFFKYILGTNTFTNAIRCKNTVHTECKHLLWCMA